MMGWKTDISGRRRRWRTTSVFLLLASALLATHPVRSGAQDFQGPGLDLLRKMEDLFRLPPAETSQSRQGPELPAIRPLEQDDPVEALLGPRRSPDSDAVFAGLQALSPDASEENKTDAIRLLSEVVVREHDRFIWTTYGRWTSARRLARELLNRLGAEKSIPAIKASSYRSALLRTVAAKSLRTAHPQVSSRLFDSWIATRLDSGAAVVREAAGSDVLVLTKAGMSRPTARAAVTDPIAAPLWTQDAGSPEWRKKVRTLTQDRRASNESTLQTAQPAMTRDRIVWRSAVGLAAVDRASGRLIWEIPLPDAPESIVVTSPTAPSTPSRAQNWQRRSGEGSLPHLVFNGGPRLRPVADDERCYIIIDRYAFSPRLRTQRLTFRASTADDADLGYGTSLLRAIDVRNGRTLWEVGGESLDDPFDRPLAGCFFLGEPTLVGDDLLVLAELRGEICLYVLNAATGRPRWSQPLCAADTPIDDWPTRRFWSVSPAVQDGVAICPTGVGWVVAVDIDGRELLWASRVSPKQERLRQFAYARLDDVDETWRPARPMIKGGLAWVFPPESGGVTGFTGFQRAVGLDITSGQRLQEIGREDALVPVELLSANSERSELLVAGKRSLTLLDVTAPATTANSMTVWRTELGQGHLLTGRPIVIGSTAYLPVDGSSLWAVNLADGSIASRRKYDGSGTLGSLFVNESGIVSCNATSLVRLKSDRDPAPADLVGAFFHARGQGDLELALERIGRVAREPKQLASATAVDRILTAAIDTVAEALSRNDARAIAAAERLKIDEVLAGLARTPRQRLLVEQLITQKDLVAQRYLNAARRLIDMAADPNVSTVTADSIRDFGDEIGRSVRLDRWVTAEFSRCWDMLTAAEQRETRQYAAEAAVTLQAQKCLAIVAPVQEQIATRLSAARSLPAASIDDATIRLAAELLATPGGQDEYRELLRAQAETLPWRGQLEPLPVWTTEVGFERSGIGVNRGTPQSIPILTDDSVNPLANVVLSMNRSLQSIAVRSVGDGHLVATLPLIRKTRRSYDGQPYAWLSAGQLLIGASGRLHAYSIESWREQWHVDLSPDQPFYRLPSDRSFFVGRFRDQTLPPAGAESAVAAISPSVVVIEEQGRVVAVDRRNGSVCWARELPPAAEILGATDHLLVIQARDDWLCYGLQDGRTYEIELPSRATECLAVTPDGVVTIDPDGFSGPIRVDGWDLSGVLRGSEPRTEWSGTWANTALAACLGHRTMVVLTDDSTLTIVDLETGRDYRGTSLPGLKNDVHQSTTVAGFFDASRVFLTSDRRGPEDDRFTTEGGNALEVSGTVAAFDRQSGQPLWEPIENARGNLLWRASLESPVLLFVERDRRMVAQQFLTRFRLSGYGMTNGQPLFDVTEHLPDGHVSGVVYQPEDNLLSVRLMASKIRFGPRLRAQTSPVTAQ